MHTHFLSLCKFADPYVFQPPPPLAELPAALCLLPVHGLQRGQL